MKHVLSFYLNSNIFVALSAFCLYKVSEILFDIQNYQIALFVFFSTLFAYNYMRSSFLSQTINSSFKIESSQINNGLLLSLSALASIFISIVLGLKFIQLLFLPIVISALYPLSFTIHNIKFSLRDVPFLKIFIIAFVWSYVTLLLPALYLGVEINYFLISNFLQRFLFILAISIPFDIRDFKIDRMKTLPNTIGVENSKFFAWFCLVVIDLLLIIDLVYNDITIPFFIAVFCSIELCALCIYFANSERPHVFYSFFVEGLSIIMYLFVLIALMF